MDMTAATTRLQVSTSRPNDRRRRVARACAQASGRIRPPIIPAPIIPAAENAAPAPDTVIYLKDGTSFAVKDYWVADGQLHYVTSYGGENAVDLGAFDLQRTTDENAKQGIRSRCAPRPNPNPQRPNHRRRFFFTPTTTCIVLGRGVKILLVSSDCAHPPRRRVSPGRSCGSLRESPKHESENRDADAPRCHPSRM